MADGILNLNKPVGISSAAAVGRVKRTLPRGTKVGHAGTLDPFASGVLLLLIGRATKLCERLMDSPKQYEATIKLGATTETDDPESPERPAPEVAAVPLAAIESALPRFVGSIQQVPPAFSALKVGGLRAYSLARAGETVSLAPRTVQVYGIERLHYDWPLLRLRIDCGRGTYIRAIARDLGATLGTGGYLTKLCRTRVGNFTLDGAAALAEITADNLPELVAAAAESVL